MSASFVHLHCHSEYSILECPIRIKHLIKKAQALGMKHVAVTDNATMYGAIDFYQQAKQAGLNPIIGADCYLTPTITQKERFNSRLILLCQSFTGYQNLIKLISIAHLEGMYYKPRLDLETIEKHKEGLIAICPSGRGPLSQAIQAYDDEAAFNTAQKLKHCFGDNLYFGIQKIGNPYEDVYEEAIKDLSQKLSVPIVALNDVYFLEKEDYNLRDILYCIQTGKQIEDDNRIVFDNDEQYFKSPEEMEACFPDHPEYLTNTVKLAETCALEIEMEQVLLPRFECPDQLSSEDYLKKLVWEGIDDKYPERTNEIQERVDFELNIINKMHYANYFLIIFDFLDFCIKANIPVGPGRGSAAGSIVAYALNITKLDPLKYNLLFERFLNPERISMPDIDIDFCINRRSEVIDYIVDTYGQDCVSQIITFGTMQARAVVRDVGRALDIPLSDVDRIAKLIPSAPGAYTSIHEALDQIPELKKAYDTDKETKEWLDISQKLEGITRHTSTHAAGVVISRDPLTTIIPMTSNDGQVATQYAMADVEKIGLLKMDILGLRNLTVIDTAVKHIRKRHDADFDIETISVDDKASYDHLCKGYGMGVFQLESAGMRKLLKDMQPRVFEDVIALLALYRPGPLGSGMVNDFISNKSGKTDVHYSIDTLEPILKETYGMIVYQEQVMQIASVIGGFSLGQADMLRRAMGKKKKDVMDKMREDFLAGAIRKNIDPKKARSVFDLCYKFAEYGFNKSHSTAYALISYQTAFLKANYPVEYMAALLSSVVSNSEKTANYIQECQNLQLDVLPPSVNESFKDFTIVTKNDKTAIRFGLSAIKNVGEGAIESIIDNHPYNDLVDFCSSVDLKQCNKRVIESLIKAGAMDDFGDRSYLLAIYEAALEQTQIMLKERSNGQIGLFANDSSGVSLSMDSLKVDNYRVYSDNELLKMEKELLGLFISGHPLNAIQHQLAAAKQTISSINEKLENKLVTITGYLSGVRRIITKTKKEMLTGEFEDFTGSLTVLVFQNKDFEEIAPQFQDDQIVTITGRVRPSQENYSLICQSITVLERTNMSKIYHIDVDGLEYNEIKQIQTLMLKFRGNCPVHLKFEEATIQTHQKYWIKDDELCRAQLENAVGAGRIWVM